MKMNSGQLQRYLLLAVLLLLLVFPYLQKKMNLLKLEPLKGAIVEAKNVEFSLDEWFSGKYQHEKETYLNESFGGRSFFIRINNQLGFSLFNKAKANGVVIGKENCLYEENYIKAYYGDDFVGKDSIELTAGYLKFIQDTLKKLNKDFILVFAADKASYYPEYIPDEYHKTRGLTNYQYYLQQVKEKNVNYIDFSKYFNDHKNTSAYPLYSKYGIHWSDYSISLVADSIIRYIEKLREIEMNHPYWNEIVQVQAKGGDYDIADGMNLLFRIGNDQLMAYPNVLFSHISSKKKPSVLVISDSFYWGMYNFGISEVFSSEEFWFYNKEAYSKARTVPRNVGELNLGEELSKYDVVIILSTEMNLRNLGWGFIGKAYDLYKGDGMQRRQEAQLAFQRKVEFERRRIKSDPAWMKDIAAKAKAKNISVDSMITLDAIWLIQQEKNK